MMQTEKSSKRYCLVVNVRRGHDFADKKLIGSHAVYVAIDCNGETKHTKTISNVDECSWNESFRFESDDMIEYIDFRVRDDRSLLPNLNLGHYRVSIQDKLVNYNANQQPIIIEDGEVALRDVLTGKLDIRVEFSDSSWQNVSSLPVSALESSAYSENLQSLSTNNDKYTAVQQSTFESLPNELNKDVLFTSNNNSNNNIKDNTEVQILPTIHVQEQPVIIEKEIEYIKPVEIHQTVVHRIKPTVIEQPVIIEKHEHYREPTKVEHEETTIERQEMNDNGINNINLDEEVINKLNEKRRAEFNDTTPIVEHCKEQVLLDTKHKVQPTKVIEKEVEYIQPVEVTKVQIERVKPTVVENVTLEKEHVHEKMAPEIITQDAQHINEGHEFFSKTSNNIAGDARTEVNKENNEIIG